MAATHGDVVVGVDVSTTAVKAIAWDTEGHALTQTRCPLDTRRPAPGHFEQDARDWYTALCECLRELTATIAPHRVAALALAHQRETVVPIDASCEPVGPALLWLDSRAQAWIERVAPAVDAETLRGITGKTPNYGLSLYKIAWLRDSEPERFAASAYFTDIQGFLAQRLTGRFTTSYSAADPTGLFDLSAYRWSATLCESVGIAPAQLPDVIAPGTVIGAIHAEAAAATGLPEGTPLVAAGGDGQCAGLGVGAVAGGRAYLNLGTAVVAGVPCERPAVDPAWRTLCGGGASGYYLESSLRSGALLCDWYLKEICGLDPAVDHDALLRLEQAADRIPPGSNGLVLLPYWEGVMNPHWDERSHGAILGLTSEHDRASLYRALIEGVTMEQVLFLDAVGQRAEVDVHELLTMGGLAASDLWCQLLADVLNRPIARSASIEAASLGAAMCAAAGAGLFDRPETAAKAMAADPPSRFTPRPTYHERYRELLAVYADTYATLRPLLHRLNAFR